MCTLPRSRDAEATDVTQLGTRGKGSSMTPLSLLRRWKMDRIFFSLMYRRGRAPWDTGVTPPELVEAVEGPHPEPPGYALDIGCGTGTNTLYLARHGWQAIGIDFAEPAIRLANRKLRESKDLTGSARFVRMDATKLASARPDTRCSLLLDLGCFHGIPVDSRAGYVQGVTRWAAPNALYLLYSFGPRDIGGRSAGMTPEDVRWIFAPAFTVERVVQGTDTGRGFSSAWYWLRRQ